MNEILVCSTGELVLTRENGSIWINAFIGTNFSHNPNEKWKRVADC
jgi:hypothetical protein